MKQKKLNEIAFNKINKVIAKENIANKDMDIYLKALKTNEWDSIYEKGKVEIDFGKAEYSLTGGR